MGGHHKAKKWGVSGHRGHQWIVTYGLEEGEY